MDGRMGTIMGPPNLLGWGSETNTQGAFVHWSKLTHVGGFSRCLFVEPRKGVMFLLSLCFPKCFRASTIWMDQKLVCMDASKAKLLDRLVCLDRFACNFNNFVFEMR